MPVCMWRVRKLMVRKHRGPFLNLTPVDARTAALGEDALNQFWIEDLGEIVADEIESCFCVCVHDASRLNAKEQVRGRRRDASADFDSPHQDLIYLPFESRRWEWRWLLWPQKPGSKAVRHHYGVATVRNSAFCPSTFISIIMRMNFDPLKDTLLIERTS